MKAIETICPNLLLWYNFFCNVKFCEGVVGLAGNYNSKDIVILEGLDAVRLRPGMYIGTTGIKGMHHLLWEIVDNSIDEIANGYGDKIKELFEDLPKEYGNEDIEIVIHS